MEAVELKLRTEQPADYRETENVTREAFWNLYSPGCCEHYLLHVMRGDPDYYFYQGFVPAEMLGIRTADNMYAMALHVCELYDGALSGIRGRYVEDSIYDIDPSAAEAFDREFPAKGKVVGTESQRRFDEIVVVRRPAE